MRAWGTQLACLPALGRAAEGVARLFAAGSPAAALPYASAHVPATAVAAWADLCALALARAEEARAAEGSHAPVALARLAAYRAFLAHVAAFAGAYARVCVCA